MDTFAMEGVPDDEVDFEADDADELRESHETEALEEVAPDVEREDRVDDLENDLGSDTGAGVGRVPVDDPPELFPREQLLAVHVSRLQWWSCTITSCVLP